MMIPALVVWWSILVLHHRCSSGTCGYSRSDIEDGSSGSTASSGTHHPPSCNINDNYSNYWRCAHLELKLTESTFATRPIVVSQTVTYILEGHN